MNYVSKFELSEVGGDILADPDAGTTNEDIKEVAANALAHAKILLSHWLEGKFEGDEFVALNPSRDDGKPGSFKVNVKTGAGEESKKRIILEGHFGGATLLERKQAHKKGIIDPAQRNLDKRCDAVHHFCDEG